jgi:hypothetical protein
MTDSIAGGNTAQAGSDPATARVDVQDPLPETSWLWRRIYVFTFSMISVAFILYGLESLHGMREAEAVYRITRYMIAVHAMLILFYMVAPSAEQIVKLIQAARIIREGVPITRSAVVETPQGGRTEVTTTAGAVLTPEPVPVAPAPTEEEQDYAPRSKT